ncbi:MAG TPA: alpha/beta fold hydrolase [Gammaproteobacteria bacterium]|nr:alpha/beta fold hydrolase [Gammaproteobacteria bacterium]
MRDPILDKLHYPDFKSVPIFSSGKAQTLLTFFYPALFDIPPTEIHALTLPDDDKLVLMEYKPSTWRPGKRIIVLVHGLTGSFNSKYNVRLCRLWMKVGFMVIRLNLRGCGPGTGLARHPYNSGRSEDTRFVVRWLYERYPNSPVTQVGFSLGGNITLKMAAEDGKYPAGNLDSIIAVSPPVDLHACSALLHKPENRVFEKYFVQTLIKDYHTRRSHFPDLPELQLDPNMALLDFDNLYTAPYSGFKDAIDYYTQCSSGMILDKIKLPTFILYAKDDPFITIERFMYKMKTANFDTLVTTTGGHLGWLGSFLLGTNRHWMDGVLVRWLAWFLSHQKSTIATTS